MIAPHARNQRKGSKFKEANQKKETCWSGWDRVACSTPKVLTGMRRNTNKTHKCHLLRASEGCWSREDKRNCKCRYVILSKNPWRQLPFTTFSQLVKSSITHSGNLLELYLTECSEVMHKITPESPKLSWKIVMPPDFFPVCRKGRHEPWN